MKTIPLLGSDKVTKVSDVDYPGLSQFKWRLNYSGYVIRDYYNFEGKGRQERMHRRILDAAKGIEVDHINRDRLDNTRINLRLCNRFDNAKNTSGRKHKISQYKGVTWDKSRDSWMARITSNNIVHNLGRFKSEMAAAKAYDNAAYYYHKEFASLNFPND